MPDDNRFAGLSEAVDDDGGDDSPTPEPEGTTVSTERPSARATTEAESPATEPDDTEPSSDSASGNSVDTDPGPGSEDDDPTAFPFDATEKKTVYVRPDTLDELEDARALVDAQLRTDHDVRDLTGREFYDAAFRFAASDTDALIEEILEAREE